MSIHIYAAGGVGNQLFQIARGCCLSGGRIVIVDTSSLGRVLRWIPGWGDHPQWLDMAELCDKLGLDFVKATYGDLIVLALLKLCGQSRGSSPSQLVYSLRSGGWQFGYFQDPSGVNIASVLRVVSAISDKYDDSLRELDAPKYALHYRGGDFLGSTQFNSSRDVILGYLDSLGSSEVLVVTNDKVGLKRWIGEINCGCSYSDGTPLEDFLALSKATEVFVGGSTFAFWAIALGALRGNTKVVFLELDNPLLPLYQLLCAKRDIAVVTR